ncbi:MAG: hypothetical protein JXP34_27555 [Planctomycetes bacterium]|nr:hypothetical protein [Planctomycetota bacterium]
MHRIRVGRWTIVSTSIALCAIAAAGFLALRAEGLEKPPTGDELLGKFPYGRFEPPSECGGCHDAIFRQWRETLMAQSFTHEWDEIEYFELALPHALKEPKVAGVKEGCNGCHAPLAFLAGDIPPKRPAEKTRANEGVSCEICHSICGYAGGDAYNFNWAMEPGETVRSGHDRDLDEHPVKETEVHETTKICGTCHNEKSPFGVWVKATQLEWEAGPYAKQGVLCQNCHMPKAEGMVVGSAEKPRAYKHHIFKGAHDPSKLRGAIEVSIRPGELEAKPGATVFIEAELYNGKAGHKIPTGSVEERVLWLHVEATDAAGKTYHLPVDKKGFAGEEYTIAGKAKAYFDIGDIKGIPSFPGLDRDREPEGDRIFRMPYFDPKGRMTVCQWNTASLGVDYRIGPRETKAETYTWKLPAGIARGPVRIRATLNYRLVALSVAEYMKVPEEDWKVREVNCAETTFTVK